MSDSPHIWGIAEDIVIDLFIANPTTGTGLTGQAGFITLTIQKKSDSRYWNGTTWLAPYNVAPIAEVDATNSPGLYRYILPGVGGNFEADVYYTHASISNPPTIEGDDYSIHISRDVAVNVYESEPL